MTKTAKAHQLYLLIVNYNSSQLIQRFINSLQQEVIAEEQIIIVNNSPKDKDICSLNNGTIKIIEAESNLGFGRACNLGLDWIYNQNSKAIAWLINPDTYFDLDTTNREKYLDLAISFFQKHSQISILGTTVYDSDRKITSAGGKFTPGTAALETINSLPEDLTADYWHTDWTSGCSLLINLTNFPACPHFDPRYFLYYEDLDFCLRYGQQGHQIAVTPLLKIFHDTSTISDRNLFTKYQHVTHSYLIHIEKHGSLNTFVRTNLRMMLNTLRLLIFKPQQGLGKLIGIYRYWHTRLSN